jgi:peroxiredoxin
MKSVLQLVISFLVCATICNQDIYCQNLNPFFVPITSVRFGTVFYHCEKKLDLNDNPIIIHNAQFSFVKKRKPNPFIFLLDEQAGLNDTVTLIQDDVHYFVATNSGSTNHNIHRMEERKINWKNILITLNDEVFTGLISDGNNYIENVSKSVKRIVESDTIISGIIYNCLHLDLTTLDTNVKKWTKEFYFSKDNGMLVGYYGQHLWLNDSSYSRYWLDSISTTLSSTNLQRMIVDKKQKYLRSCKYISEKESIPNGTSCSVPVQKVLTIGSHVPQFNGIDNEGKMFSFGDVKSKFVLLDFWYAGCSPCAYSIQPLAILYNEFKDSGLTIISINSVDSLNTINKYHQRHSIRYQAVYADAVQIEKFGVHSYPYFFLLDQSRNIVFAYDGYSQELYGKVRKAFKELSGR